MSAVFRARSFVRRFPLFCAVLLAQLLILAALVAASLRPLASLDVPLDTLTETADGTARVSEPMMLPSGGYRVTVCYGVPKTQESTGALATLDFASAGNPAALRSDTITLTSVYSTVTARLWVGTAVTLDDLTMTVTPAGDGQGDISLQSVTLAEQPVWRFVSLVGWLLLYCCGCFSLAGAALPGAAGACRHCWQAASCWPVCPILPTSCTPVTT